MQTPKQRTPRKISPRSEAAQKNSPKAGGSSETPQKISPRLVRQLKTGPRYSDHTAASVNLASRAPKETTPKVDDTKSSKSPASHEKKRPSKVTELESQITKLESDLKVVKDQLCSTEALKKQAQKDAEESNQQLSALSLKLEESPKQVLDHDSAALSSALDEIKQLKLQLQMVPESEPDQKELHKLKEDLSDTLSLVEDMKNQIRDSKESESQAKAQVGETLIQLETAKKLIETLKLDALNSKEAYDVVVSELQASKARVSYLEELDIEQLRSALEASEIREAELDKELRKSKYEIEELKANLMDKETELQGICEENEGLTVKLGNTLSGQREFELEKDLHKSKAEIENLKSLVVEKEKEWKNISDENENLKLDTNDKDGSRVMEQLEQVRVANAEMEGELRRVKVQADQWRKAAEAAAAMLSAGNVVERTGSMDSHFSPRMGKVSSPYADDIDDEELMKKKNANMLRRIGVLWKKPQK